MMLIPSFVAASSIHGVGMFTAVTLRKGDLLWEFTHGFDRSFTQEEFNALPEIARRFISRHGFFAASGLWIISGDHDQYVNHSTSPNMVELVGNERITASLVAARDIMAGEELTQNYMEWDKAIYTKGIS